MKYVRIKTESGASWGVVNGDQIRLLAQAPYQSLSFTGISLPVSDAVLLAPCEPTKIVAVGKNYFDHIRECDSTGDVPPNPILFIKPPTSLNDPNAPIAHPSISTRVDYEGELAFVIGKTAKNVRREDAASYILGYTCLNDVTARDLQANDGQWTRAKGFDGFAPVGPLLTDEVDPSDLAIETCLNGEVKQSARTSLFIWKIPELVEFITQCMTLLPGDVVTTGTPAGIGRMLPGDVVEVRIEGIGVLKNHIV